MAAVAVLGILIGAETIRRRRVKYQKMNNSYIDVESFHNDQSEVYDKIIEIMRDNLNMDLPLAVLQADIGKTIADSDFDNSAKTHKARANGARKVLATAALSAAFSRTQALDAGKTARKYRLAASHPWRSVITHDSSLARPNGYVEADDLVKDAINVLNITAPDTHP